ncbi:hypothetical protein VKT23_017668 [Stygiomarasmius scandens]|uniref:Uncharacterized protein n=1 Tax=Marasmiellus scandens TaxID=2682957 RepID=A0ABR1ISX5_9AGAR
MLSYISKLDLRKSPLPATVWQFQNLFFPVLKELHIKYQYLFHPDENRVVADPFPAVQKLCILFNHPQTYFQDLDDALHALYIHSGGPIPPPPTHPRCPKRYHLSFPQLSFVYLAFDYTLGESPAEEYYDAFSWETKRCEDPAVDFGKLRASKCIGNCNHHVTQANASDPHATTSLELVVVDLYGGTGFPLCTHNWLKGLEDKRVVPVWALSTEVLVDEMVGYEECGEEEEDKELPTLPTGPGPRPGGAPCYIGEVMDNKDTEAYWKMALKLTE